MFVQIHNFSKMSKKDYDKLQLNFSNDKFS